MLSKIAVKHAISNILMCIYYPIYVSGFVFKHAISNILMCIYYPIYVSGFVLFFVSRLILALSHLLMLNRTKSFDVIKNTFKN